MARQDRARLEIQAEIQEEKDRVWERPTATQGATTGKSQATWQYMVE